MIDKIEKLVSDHDELYDQLYDQCNFIIREVGYDSNATEKNVARLEKDFPNIAKKVLLEVLLEAHDDYHQKTMVTENVFFCDVCNRDTLHEVTHLEVASSICKEHTNADFLEYQKGRSKNEL